MRSLTLRITLVAVAVFQMVLALAFLFAPGPFAAAVGLAPAAGWAPWMFAMFSARALGFAYGCLVAFRNPIAGRSWITAMIGVQAIDWIATVWFIAAGTITVTQASTAAFMPLLFIAGLVAGYPRDTTRQANGPEAEVPGEGALSVGALPGR